jgi:hypothetical protein
VLLDLIKSTISELIPEQNVHLFLKQLFEKHSRSIEQSKSKEEQIFITIYQGKEVISKHIKFLNLDMKKLSDLNLARERIKLLNDIQLGVCMVSTKHTRHLKLVNSGE